MASYAKHFVSEHYEANRHGRFISGKVLLLRAAFPILLSLLAGLAIMLLIKT